MKAESESDMIDIASERILTLDQAAEKLLVTKQIVMKWIRFGSKGVKLEEIRFGAYWRASEQALQRFGERLTPSFEPATQIPTFTAAQWQRQSNPARIRLEQMMGVRRCADCRVVIDTYKKTIPKQERLWCPTCLIKQPSSTIGQRFHTFRWGAKLTQDDLVEKTGIRLELIRAYEKGRQSPAASLNTTSAPCSSRNSNEQVPIGQLHDVPLGLVG